MRKIVLLPEIGDTIYAVEDDFKNQCYCVVEENIRLIEIGEYGIGIFGSFNGAYLLSDLNKDWFLNKRKAERAAKTLNKKLFER